MTRRRFKRVGVALPATGLLLLSMAAGAQATTISGNLTADNAFLAFLSTDNTTLGTPIAQGNDWGATFSFTDVPLTAGQTYYLQIEAINYGGPGDLIGQFNLSDSNFQFSNGTQILLTDTTNWTASFNDSNSDPNTAQSWVTPTGGVISVGANGISPWGFHSAISASAEWIDADTNGLSVCGNCTVDFSTPITFVGGAGSAPEPGSFILFAAGLAAAAAIRIRRAIAVRA